MVIVKPALQELPAVARPLVDERCALFMHVQYEPNEFSDAIRADSRLWEPLR